MTVDGITNNENERGSFIKKKNERVCTAKRAYWMDRKLNKQIVKKLRKLACA